MLAVQKQHGYARKMVTLPNGAKAFVVFELTEINGKITAKAVFIKVLEQAVEKNPVMFISGGAEKKTVKPIVSPFFAEVENIFKNFSFTVSQPTRAPDFE